ncbi:MAG: hypothetical protein AAGF12_29890, partial [Myxococcota bacterium]
MSVARTEVRGFDLNRHSGRRYRGGKAYAVSSGLGMPRLWSYATAAVLDGFGEALGDDGDGPGGEALEAAVRAARQTLARRCDALIERMLPDATLIASGLSNGALHVISAGPGRVYLHRGGQPKRLTPRDESNEGILKGTLARCSVDLEPEDIVLIGSVSAFSVRAIARLASVLDADRRTPPNVLASLLTEP